MKKLTLLLSLQLASLLLSPTHAAQKYDDRFRLQHPLSNSKYKITASHHPFHKTTLHPTTTPSPSNCPYPQNPTINKPRILSDLADTFLSLPRHIQALENSWPGCPAQE